MTDTMKMSHIYKAPAAIIPVLIPAQVSQKLSSGRGSKQSVTSLILKMEVTCTSKMSVATDYGGGHAVA
jgi:hypothetical protein